MRYVFLLISAVVVAACGRASAEPAQSAAANGRYQILNGTPQFARYTMLLDTQTGRTWQICQMQDSSSGWCSMRIEQPKSSQ